MEMNYMCLNMLNINIWKRLVTNLHTASSGWKFKLGLHNNMHSE